MRPDLTICIPTFERADLLSECLESLKKNAAGVPILVEDNASRDHTSDLVAGHAAAGEPVRYILNPGNVGAVENLLRVVHNADSEYVALMSDDDVLAESLLANLEPPLAAGADIVILGRADYTVDMGFLRNWPYIASTETADRAFDLFDNLQTQLQAGRCLAAAFSFVSGQVYRRSDWLEAVDTFRNSIWAESFERTLFPQAWIGLYLSSRGRKVAIVDKPIISLRHGNDRVCDNDTMRRGLLDLREFQGLASVLFSDNKAVADDLRKLIGRNLVRHLFPTLRTVIWQRAAAEQAVWRTFWKEAAWLLGVRRRVLAGLPYPVARRLSQWHRVRAVGSSLSTFMRNFGPRRSNSRRSGCGKSLSQG